MPGPASQSAYVTSPAASEPRDTDQHRLAERHRVLAREREPRQRADEQAPNAIRIRKTMKLIGAAQAAAPGGPLGIERSSPSGIRPSRPT